ncbi:MAG: L,D-transpeptidase [Akkermansiaceae bacterium]|nr:L,D-transpeptidase [Akkermansiaceae bacterium]
MRLFLAILGAVAMASCQHRSPEEARIYYEQEGNRLEEATRNTRKACTFEAFIAHPGYRETRDIWRGAALNQYAPSRSHVEILLEPQRGRLYINGAIAMDFPICSGRVGGQETPKGAFRISQKARQYRSNRYGSFVSRDGKRVVKSDISSSDAAPKGSVFKGASMPYWMRFNGSVGMHVGNVYRYSASHGCVRVPVEACSVLFEKLAVGSKVIVK